MQKKHQQDFSLWKGRTNKEVGFDVEFVYDGEKFNSHGRPGWHIECNVMIHETIGSDLDIHFGGIDLKFPHHHNERLQAHAYYHPKYQSKDRSEDIESNQLINDEEKQWTDKFLHIGHLCVIAKNSDNQLVQQKMSKSLKNFTTIDEALNTISANQMRWMFSFHKWTDPMDFSEDTIAQAKQIDSVISNFFNRIINYPFDRLNIKYNEKEHEMMSKFYLAKKNIIMDLYAFKLDVAVKELLNLLNITNSYVSNLRPNGSLVNQIYDWVAHLTNLLGFEYGVIKETSTAEVMNILINMRTTIREITREKDIPQNIRQKLFEILDSQRNVQLPDIDIILQDTKESSSWFKKQ